MSKEMSKPSFHDGVIGSFGVQEHGLSNRAAATADAGEARFGSRSALAELVSSHLRSNSLRQIDFCRQVGFDQGLLSKILSSVVNTLNVETALKLAEGMNLPPRVVFGAIGKSDVHEMLMRIYGGKQANRPM